jgi:ornithine cyclodeaminase
LLSDLNTGTPLALIDGYEISALRTGGVTGVALKLLARSDTERLLCCGAGHQAHSQLRASVAVLPALKHVAVWSRTILRASKFCGKLEAEFGPNPVFQPVSDFEEYVGTADVIMGVTSASSPYLHKRHFKDGQLYFHIGMNDVSRGAIKSFDKIVCDDFEAGRDGSSQSLFRLYRDEPDIAGRVISLESLLCHGAPRRPSLGKRVMFDSFGLPVFDLVLAAEVYRHAIDNGLGWDASLNSCSEGSEQ